MKKLAVVVSALLLVLGSATSATAHGFVTPAGSTKQVNITTTQIAVRGIGSVTMEKAHDRAVICATVQMYTGGTVWQNLEGGCKTVYNTTAGQKITKQADHPCSLFPTTHTFRVAVHYELYRSGQPSDIDTVFKGQNQLLC